MMRKLIVAAIAVLALMGPSFAGPHLKAVHKKVHEVHNKHAHAKKMHQAKHKAAHAARKAAD